MTMNGAHLHLILNHIPVVGIVFGLVVLAVAIGKSQKELQKVSLGIFVLIALFTIPVYLSGHEAEEVVEHVAEISESLIDEHAEVAFVAFVGTEIVGIFALFCGFLLFRSHSLAKGTMKILLVLVVLLSGLMAWTANLGGKIHHPEIRPGFVVPAGEGEHEHEHRHEH